MISLSSKVQKSCIVHSILRLEEILTNRNDILSTADLQSSINNGRPYHVVHGVGVLALILTAAGCSASLFLAAAAPEVN